MKILGLSVGHDASACLVVDGKLISAISSERILREKKSHRLSWDVINYVLEPSGLTIEDIDYVAIGKYSPSSDEFVRIFYKPEEMSEYPFSSVHPNFNSLFNGNSYVDGLGYEIFTDTHFYKPTMDYKQRDYVTCTILFDNDIKKECILINHHMAHAASVFYTSNLEKSAIFSVDASGLEGPNSSGYFLGDGNSIQYIGTPGLMIGSLYNAMTEILSYGSGLIKAGTMMGAASYGKPSQKVIDNWEKIVEPIQNRKLYADDITFNLWAATYITDKPIKELMFWHEEDKKILLQRLHNWTYLNYTIERDYPIDSLTNFNHAASVQYVLERAIIKYTNELFDLTEGLNDNNICLVGGTILNCTSNYKTLNEMKFKNLHLYPATGDDGTAVGAALYQSYHLAREPRHIYTTSEVCYTGREYDDLEDGLDYDEELVATMLSESKIVAWFQGGSEFGPRALGHRSFLANPTDPKMKDILNKRVKHREWFRPFAPIVLKDRCSEWFDISVDSPYMLYACPVKQPWLIPAVTHVDSTARVQTLDEKTNNKLYNLIKRFDSITGVPVILNTSLNVNGQPIVETPKEALELFYSSDIDAIVIDNKMFLK
tara:strand:- start:3171 stop:4970 length:1800 start_codon:yes stop_codon:yes gene_type:complete